MKYIFVKENIQIIPHLIINKCSQLQLVSNTYILMCVCM